MNKNCPIHGVTPHYVRRDNQAYKCKKCNVEAVARRRKRVRLLLISEAGGQCIRCGYDRCSAALEFHHRDPATKEFPLGARGLTMSLKRMQQEAAKCDLLCANCHREKHFCPED